MVEAAGTHDGIDETGLETENLFARSYDPAGHYALARSQRASGGEELARYDIRRSGAERTRTSGRFTAMALNHAGFAAFISRSPAGALAIGSIPGAGLLDPVSDPSFLRLAGDSIAYKTPFGVSLLSPDEDFGGGMYASAPPPAREGPIINSRLPCCADSSPPRPAVLRR